MRLRLATDGSRFHALMTESGELVEGVVAVSWRVEATRPAPVAVIEIAGVELELLGDKPETGVAP